MIIPKMQLGLRRLLLILATCAAWFAYFGNEYQRTAASANLIRSLKATRSLDVQDTSRITAKFTAMQSSSSWSQGMASSYLSAYQSLQCYVPNSGWEICIATRDLPAQGFPNPRETAPLRKGTSAIELAVSTLENEFEIKVIVEETVAFVVREDNTWCNAKNLIPGARPKQILQSDDVSPIELTRSILVTSQRKGRMTSVEETPAVTDGVLIWLRKIGDH